MSVWFPDAEIDEQPDDGGSMLGGPPRGGVHSNCGRRSSVPYYTGWIGTKAPGVPWIVQFRRADRAAKSLRNLAGGVQTNRRGSVNPQWCLAGKAGTPEGRDPVIYEAFRQIIDWHHVDHGIPKTLPTRPRHQGTRCYGYNSPCRMTVDEWNTYTGWYEHRDVPENTHWDANLTDQIWAQLFGGPIVTPPPPIIQPQEDYMLPLAYGDGYQDPPADSVYAGQDRSHRKADVQYLQLIAGSGVDAGFYGANTSLDIAAALGDGSDGRWVGYAEWDNLLGKRYGGPGSLTGRVVHLTELAEAEDD